jgi:cellulose synthase/poly-beta-1,6-N-acetylglucosamine synthase-like glycosyltransferase
MLTRALFLAVGWFVISLLATLAGGNRLRYGHVLFSIAWLSLVLILGDLWALLTFGIPWEILALSGLTFIFGLVCFWWLRDWNAFGQATWVTTVLGTLLFVAYAFSITTFSPLNPISFIIALIFFFIEMTALVLALSHTYENLDVMCRVRWRNRIEQIEPVPGYTPMVSLHVPAYDEPPEVVEETLRSLAQLDYPNYEVLVIDNNTPQEGTWRPLQKICHELGPRFRFLHLDRWPGYKSGALNFALTQTAPDAEIISIVDADYRLKPNFLRETVPVFAHPQVAFLQAPQDFRDYKGNSYLESIYYSYKYFFEVSMPVRNEYNAIIFAGTMGLIRKLALQQIGGWDEWCITEDAEASLRILKLGYKSLYYKKSFGQGLMPYSFDGLKKQRFRWCFGGIQILKKHWEKLMPWAHMVDPTNHLTFAQRYFYLVGGLQWFTDVFNLLFAFFLVLGGVLSMLAGSLTIRPLTAPLMVLPAIFLFLHLWRFAWVLRHILHLPWGVALRSMYGFFSAGWVVTLACFQGLIQPEGVFLRTPKSKGRSRVLQALRVTQWETGIGLLCLATALLAVVSHPNLYTLFLALLLTWQSTLYLSAPAYSLMSASAALGRPLVVREGEVGRGGGVFEHWAARWALGLAAALLLVGLVIQFLPQPAGAPDYTKYQPPEIPPRRLVGLERVPIEERAFTPTPTQTPLPTPTAILEPTDTLPPPTEPLVATPTALPPTPAATFTTVPTATVGIPPSPVISETATVAPAPTETLPVTSTPGSTAEPTGTAPVTPSPGTTTPSATGTAATPAPTGTLPTPTVPTGTAPVTPPSGTAATPAPTSTIPPSTLTPTSSPLPPTATVTPSPLPPTITSGPISPTAVPATPAPPATTTSGPVLPTAAPTTTSSVGPTAAPGLIPPPTAAPTTTNSVPPTAAPAAPAAPTPIPPTAAPTTAPTAVPATEAPTSASTPE